MPDRSASERAGEFVRSVLPAEPAHWLMLVGSTLLFISANFRWWPVSTDLSSIQRATLTYVLTRLLIVAGAAGFYLCLVPRGSRSRIPFYLIFISASVMFPAMFYFVLRGLIADENRQSVVFRVTDKAPLLRLDSLEAVLMDFRTGFWVAALGLALLAIFGLLRRSGRATLPVRLPDAAGAADTERFEVVDIDQRQTMRFVWAMISLIPLLIAIAELPNVLGLLVVFGRSAGSHLQIYKWGAGCSFALCLFVLIVIAIGRGAARVVRRCLRIPEAKYLALGVLIPLALAAIWPVCRYAHDRIHWAAFDAGRFDAPGWSKYFSIPDWSSLLFLIAALPEEIAWRGFLQPRFIRKYGIARGIFLLAIVWGAFHWSNDIGFRMTAVEAGLAIVKRFGMTVAVGYVLGWLTIRSGSVLPAVLAHGFYNIFLYQPVQPSWWLLYLFWGACAWVLFRYFPVTVAEPEDSGESNLAESLPA